MSHQLLKAGLPGRPHNNYDNNNNKISIYNRPKKKK